MPRARGGQRNGAISNSIFSIAGGGDSPGGPGRRGGRWPGHRIGQCLRRRWRWRQRRCGVRPEGRRHHPGHRLRVLADPAGRRRSSRDRLRYHGRNIRADVGDRHRRAGAAGGELRLPRGRRDRHRAQLQRGAERVHRRGAARPGSRSSPRTPRSPPTSKGTSGPTTSWRAPRPDNTCANCSRRQARPPARCWSKRPSPASRPTRTATPGSAPGWPRNARTSTRRCRATTTTTSAPPHRRSTTPSSANSDLVGVFADNNSSGVGAATAIKDNNAADTIPVVAFDSDPAENAALAAGTIDALVVQNPYFLGYQGVVEAAMATQGRIPPAILDPGVALADQGQHDRPGDQGAAGAADGRGRRDDHRASRKDRPSWN